MSTGSWFICQKLISKSHIVYEICTTYVEYSDIHNTYIHVYIVYDQTHTYSNTHYTCMHDLIYTLYTPGYTRNRLQNVGGSVISGFLVIIFILCETCTTYIEYSVIHNTYIHIYIVYDHTNA